MSKRIIKMYEYKAIIYRLKQGMTARQIAKEGLAGRHKINEIAKVAKQHGWLNAENNIPDESVLAKIFEVQSTQRMPSQAETHRAFITKAVNEDVSASVIHQRLVEQFNFKGAYNSIQRFVKSIKQQNLNNLTIPLNFQPGEAAQVDFGKGPTLYDERIHKSVETWFFVMTLCWSRHQYVELVTHQDIETWLRCHQNAFTWFGGVVKKIIIDNAKCAIVKACYYDPRVQRSYEAFAQAYGFVISACPPYDPQKKGRVESGVKYVKNNFLPLKPLQSLQQENKALKQWIMNTAGKRTHGSTFKQPLDCFNSTEKSALQLLPETVPIIAVWQQARLYRDCHVRYQYCCYSAPFDLYNEKLWLQVTPTIVSIHHENECVAQHSRLFQKGQFSTEEKHLPPKGRYYLKRNSSWCLERSKVIGENCALLIDHVINHRTQDLLRQAQGILSLAETYSNDRLEQACQYALTFETYDYKTIKTILADGLEKNIDDLKEPDELARGIYQGQARFQRTSHKLIH